MFIKLLVIGIMVLLIFIVLFVAVGLGLQPDWVSLVRDIILIPRNWIFVALAIGLIAYLWFQMVTWMEDVAKPNKPLSITHFTKETPSQVVGDANQAALRIFLVFILTLVVFLTLRPFGLPFPIDISSLLKDLRAFIGQSAILPESTPNPNETNTPPVNAYLPTTWPFYDISKSTAQVVNLPTSTPILIESPTATSTSTIPADFSASTPTSPVNVTPAAPPFP